jgi:two-component sensor histidine kinase
MDDLVEGVTISNEAFKKSRERVAAMGITAQKVVKDFMTADMATAYTKKLEEVAEKAGGYGKSGGAAQIDAEVNKILEKYDKNIDKQVEIQNRINMADWES